MEKFADLIWDRDEAVHRTFLEQLAPIVLFTYRRLENTQRTVAALRSNVYAKESRLIVYSDGARSEEDAADVAAVREYLHTMDGFRSVEIIERAKNLGLGENIIAGVTEAVQHYGKVIVLEDDIVTSRYFLKYMNDALKIYADEPRVMEITGNVHDIDRTCLPETYFSKRENCWGWATWARAWRFYERDPEKLLASFDVEDIYRFTVDGSNDFWEQVQQNADGRLHTWAIFWAAAVYQHGLTLISREPMDHNIGIASGGEHFADGARDVFQLADVSDRPVERFPLDIQESCAGRAAEKAFHLRLRTHVGGTPTEQALYAAYHAEPTLENFKAYFLAVQKRKREAWEGLHTFLAAHPLVYLYGAGRIARQLAQVFERMEIPFAGFIVSTGHKKEKQFLAHPVYEIQDAESDAARTGFVVAVGVAAREDVLDTLRQHRVPRENIWIPQLF